jgi:hypothetical protein
MIMGLVLGTCGDTGSAFSRRFCWIIADFHLSPSRYLVHAIAIYYGLKTWSVSTTDGRREAYVGLKEDPVTRRPSLVKSELPRPLWAVV